MVGAKVNNVINPPSKGGGSLNVLHKTMTDEEKLGRIVTAFCEVNRHDNLFQMIADMATVAYVVVNAQIRMKDGTVAAGAPL